jgi:A/G-specific adenine glycosylase
VSKFVPELKKLAAWFERQKRVLPWRDEPSVYRVWISEIMLQQTQVVTVVPYFERFLKRFPTVEALAGAPEEDVLLHWAGLGYYSRARNIHKAAKQIVAAGCFPRDREEWLEIPGVGDYTAGAILSIAQGKAEAILDGNVERVLSRVRRISRARGDAAYKARLWRLSRFFVTRAHQEKIEPSVLNQALMELGATVCTPKKPKCLLCPIAKLCRAHEFSEEEAFPPKKKPKQWIEKIETVHCLLDARGKKMWLERRKPGEWRAGLWDFPSQPIAKSLGFGGARRIGTVESRHIVTRHKIVRTTHVWQLESKLLKASEPLPDSRWVSVSDPEVAVGSALRKTLQQISETYSEALPMC